MEENIQILKDFISKTKIDRAKFKDFMIKETSSLRK